MPAHILVSAALIGAALNPYFTSVEGSLHRPTHQGADIAVAPRESEPYTSPLAILAGNETSSMASTVKITPSNFIAWIDRMPGAGGKLIVEGLVMTPWHGWHVELTPSRFCPAKDGVILLKLTVRRPRHAVAQGTVALPIRYEQKRPRALRVEVIVDNCSGFDVPVAEVF